MGISQETLQNNSFNSGWETAHVQLNENPTLVITDPEVCIAGIVKCGIGGLLCACNEVRVSEDVDLYEYVHGVNQAIIDRSNGVMV